MNITDLALDLNPGSPTYGDIFFPPQWVTGGAAILQRFVVRVRWFRGEWLLDQNQGTPWFEQVLIKNANPIGVSNVFRRVLATTPGVQSVLSFSASYVTGTRTLNIANAVAQLTTNETLQISDMPFIL